MKIVGLGSDLSLITSPLTTVRLSIVSDVGRHPWSLQDGKERNVFFKCIEALGGHFLWVVDGLAQSDTYVIPI